MSSASVLFYHRIVVEIFNQSSVLSLLDYYKTHWDANSVIIFKPNGFNFIILSLTCLMNLFTVPETKQYSRLTLYSLGVKVNKILFILCTQVCRVKMPLF